MDIVTALGLAFLTGLTVAGLAGTSMELAFGRPLCLSTPFVMRDRVVRSLAATTVAGPFMLANDALTAYRTGRIGTAALAISVAVCCVWVLATGIVVAELALAVTG